MHEDHCWLPVGVCEAWSDGREAVGERGGRPAHEAEVDGETEEQWNVDLLKKYHELLTHSTKGYGIVLTRDVDECWINKYNPEFLEVWDGNIDVALVFDMYAVVTYIADYYMKVRMNTNLLIIISSDIHSIHFRTTRERWRC